MDILTFNKKFPTEKAVLRYFIKARYNGSVVCPHCGSHKVYHRTNDPKKYSCNGCQSDFSVFAGTIFEKSCTDLRKWFLAINFILTDKKGISALQLQRQVGVTYKTAWRMLKQIRKAMSHAETQHQFEAIVEIDETYVGGKPRKGTPDYKKYKGRGTKKTPVVGIKERNTQKVHAVVAFPNRKGQKLSGKQLFNILDKICKKDTVVISDDFRSYNILDKGTGNKFFHLTVNHSAGKYSNGEGVHTNGIESFWALLKRGVYGMYHHISVKHLQEYVNEFCYRMNNRDNENAFGSLVEQCVLA